MKFYILLLIIGGFLQTSFLPLNLILILIIGRALVTDDLANYYLAFFGGIFLSILAVTNLGFWPLALLTVVKLAYLSKKLPLSKNGLTAFAIGLILIFGIDFGEAKILQRSFQLNRAIIEAVLLVPIYYFLKFWEQRFIVKPEVKLKIRNR